MPKRADLSQPCFSEEVGAGGARAAGSLLPLVYEDLLRLARNRMARLSPGQTLRPRDLVHEAYLRITREGRVPFENPRHFFFVAARAMHDILVEQARRKGSRKRGGNAGRVEFAGFEIAISAPADDILALTGALEQLDEHQRQIVDLRFFAGLTMEETAHVLDTPLRTLGRQWRYIRARLRTELTPPEERPTRGARREL